MTKIEVFCGFLESGKTTLIQHVLEQDYMRHYRRILVIQCEEGEADFRAGAIKNENRSEEHTSELQS
ncbi:MAG TPA: GTPase, partial [Ruminococcaceae bacterium]|nr:GTPase [Oscillospiraceae bacterium]